MRPVFCGNFEYETRQSDLEKLFSKYGRVDRVDIKSGFAFIYFEDEGDAEDAIRGLDDSPFGYDRRKLSVEWAKVSGKSATNKTLFVINFDPAQTRSRDIERHFEPYEKVLNVRVRRNFAFVQFAMQEEATKALECTHMSKILDRVVSVECSLRDDGESGARYSPREGGHGRRGDSPYGYRYSPSPAYRSIRPSPDYGRPSPDYGRPSPDYGCPSPDYGRPRSPDYGRSRSPDYGRSRSPRSPDYGHPRSPIYDRYNGPSYGRLGVRNTTDSEAAHRWAGEEQE